MLSQVELIETESDLASQLFVEHGGDAELFGKLGVESSVNYRTRRTALEHFQDVVGGYSEIERSRMNM